MEPGRPKKTDRRTLYTQKVIKEAMLELMNEMPYDRITVASLCRQAEITRPTFYLHYDNLSEVLDGLIDDALNDTQEPVSMHRILEDRAMLSDLSNLRGLEKKLSLSPCQRGAADPRYNVLLADPAIYSYIVERIYRARIRTEGAHLERELGLSPALAEKLLYFLVYGSFSLNRSFHWKKDREWFRTHRMLLTFVIGGYEAIRKDRSLND